jgi:hypothetical protein
MVHYRAVNDVDDEEKAYHSSPPSLVIADSSKLHSSPISSPSASSCSFNSPTFNSIRLIGGPEEDDGALIDVLDSHYEDTFSLEPLHKLLAMHHSEGKDYVLARVSTQDPRDESKFYYSIYDSHHINKVLFRTQPDQGLLHRMRAKNV